MKRSELSELMGFYTRNGCLRAPNKERQKLEGGYYKHGYEVRLVAKNRAELLKIRSLLRIAGFEVGRPFKKRSQTILPIYGKESYFTFLELLSRFKRQKARSKVASRTLMNL
jgi:hypothetical protein